MSTVSTKPRCTRCQSQDFDDVDPEKYQEDQNSRYRVENVQVDGRKIKSLTSLEQLDADIREHFARMSRIQLMNAMAQGTTPQTQQPAPQNDKLYEFMKDQNDRMFDLIEDNIDRDNEETPADNSPERIIISALAQGIKDNPKDTTKQIHTYKDKIAEYIARHPKQAEKIAKDNPELAKIIMSELKI